MRCVSKPLMCVCRLMYETDRLETKNGTTVYIAVQPVCYVFMCVHVRTIFGPADATAIPKPHHVVPHLYPDWFYLFGGK